MATIRIPEFQQQLAPQGRGPSPRANIVDVSSGLQSVAQNIQGVADAIERKKIDDDLLNLTRVQNEGAVQWATWINEAQNSWKRGDAELPQQFTELFDQWQSEIVPSFKTRQGKIEFEQRMAAFRAGAVKSAINWQASTNERLKMLDLDMAVQNMEKAAAGNPMVAEVLAQGFISDTDKMILAPEQRQAQQAQAKNRVGWSAELALLDKAPSAWSPDDKRWSWNQLTAEQQRRIKDMHENQLKQLDQRGRDLFDERVRDNTAMFMEGIEPPQEITKQEFIDKYGEEGEYRFNEYIAARDFGTAVGEFKNASVDEITQTLTASRPKPGEGFAKASQRFDMLQKAAAQVVSQREKDPGLFAAQSPLLQNVEDPQQRASLSLSIQKRWGVQNPLPLPKEQANSIVAEITRQPGDQALMTLNQLKADYGKAYGPVFAQLSAAGLPSAYVAIGAGMPEQSASILASVAQTDIKDLKAQLPPDVTPKIVNDAIGQEAQPFIQSMAGNSGGDKTISAMMESAERLAYKYVAGGMSGDKAGKRAWEQVVGAKYNFFSVNGSMVRVPISQNSSTVEDGLNAMMDRLTDAALQTPFADIPGVKKGEWAEHIKRNGYWVTDESDAGAYLFVDGAVVNDYRGKPFRVLWSETLDPRAKRLEPTGKQVGTTFTPSIGGP